MTRRAATTLLLATCTLACPNTDPVRGGNYVTGRLDGTRGGAPFAATFDFGVLQPGSAIVQPSQPIDLASAALLPLPFLVTAPGTGDALTPPALALVNLPPSLVWAGPFEFTQLLLTFSESLQWTPAPDTPPVFTFDAVEVTDDPTVPLVVRGTMAGVLTDPDGNTYTVADGTFALSAHCGPDAAPAPRLCGDTPGQAQFLGLVEGCPADLTTHFVGETTDAKYDATAHALRIGQAASSFTCREVWTPDTEPVKRRLCTSEVADFPADGCLWRAIAVTEPRARYFTISGWANADCATPVCNAYR